MRSINWVLKNFLSNNLFRALISIPSPVSFPKFSGQVWRWPMKVTFISTSMRCWELGRKNTALLWTVECLAATNISPLHSVPNGKDPVTWTLYPMVPQVEEERKGHVSFLLLLTWSGILRCKFLLFLLLKMFLVSLL